MIRLERHGDVLRLSMSSLGSRAIRYAASAYLVRDVLVDTGIPKARAALLRFLDARAAAGHALRGAVVTHQHEDHAGNVRALAARGVPLAMSAATLAAVRVVAPLGAYRRVSWGAMPPLDVPHAPFDPAPLALVPTPGHSADHHAVWDAETGTLFGGDLFLGVRVRVAHDDEDPYALARSLRAAAALSPARLFDGHRGLVARPVDALLAKARWLDDTLGAIAAHAADGMPSRAIARAVLGREGLAGLFSSGHYSHAAFVRAALERVASSALGAAHRTSPRLARKRRGTT